MPKTGAKRAKSYSDKIDADVISKRFASRRSGMIKQSSQTQSEQSILDDRVSKLLGREDISIILRSVYHSFANKLYSLSRRLLPNALRSEAVLSVPRWIGMGADLDMLDKISRIFGVSVAAPPPEKPKGSGTLEDPYMIYDVNDLQAMNDDLSSHYALGNDIDATETASWNEGAGFEPIGTNSECAFLGSFDGRGYKITNLFINRPSTIYVGLFGYVTSGATPCIIKNVGLENVNVTGDVEVGGLVGWNDYETAVDNCHSSGTVNGHEDVGGLVGTNAGTVENSYSTGSVSGTVYVGGLVGWSNWEEITDSYSTGDVSGIDIVGGLVGQNMFGTVSNSYATGSVSGEDYVGGLVGWNYQATVSDSYSTGSVIGKFFVGGLVGYNETETVSNSYSTGPVSGVENVGGLVGVNDEGTVSDSFWDIITSGQGESAGGTGKTTAEMQTLLTFSEAGWDIVLIGEWVDEIWFIDEHNDYPRFGWQFS